MKILITGALGHIGSQLIQTLPNIYPNAQLILIDNMLTQRYASLFNLPNTGKYKFIEHDILTLDIYPIIATVDFVIHLAAITDATNSFTAPEQIYENNLNITSIIAKACAKYKKPLFFPSSTSVYGPTVSKIIDEDIGSNELQPQSPYAECKLKEEALLLELAQQHKLPVTICRFGTIFGPSPGMRFHTAVNKFCWQAIHGQPITVWETAYQQKRPYLSLDDAIRIIIFILKNNLFTGEIFNVVTSNHTVQEVITHIHHFIPIIEVRFVSSKIMNNCSFEVVSTKITAKGFQFHGNLQLGISNTINLFNSVCVTNNKEIF